MGIKIKPDIQKNFIIARVAVNESKLIGEKLFSRDDTKIFIPMGYSLFYTRGAALERLKEEHEQTVKSVELVKKIKNDLKVTTLYWLRNSFDNNYEITVPWGIVFPQKSYNGQIKLKFNIENSSCNFISNCMCSCATEMKDGLNYEYLSEYYVDEKKEFQGLSITIRELLVSRLENCGENIEKIKETIMSLQGLFESIGLFLDKNSIGVIETKHLEEGRK